MQSDTLTALSPLDGRYAGSVDALRPIFSESGLIRYRVQVEVEWLIYLAEHPQIEELADFDDARKQALRGVAEHFTVANAQAVKDIEKTINHDVKAVEYFLRDKMPAEAARFVHFACTSEDINNLSYALALRDARRDVILPALDELIGALTTLARSGAALPMLSRTHGQSASPTTSPTSGTGMTPHAICKWPARWIRTRRTTRDCKSWPAMAAIRRTTHDPI